MERRHQERTLSGEAPPRPRHHPRRQARVHGQPEPPPPRAREATRGRGHHHRRARGPADARRVREGLGADAERTEEAEEGRESREGGEGRAAGKTAESFLSGGSGRWTLKAAPENATGDRRPLPAAIARNPSSTRDARSPRCSTGRTIWASRTRAGCRRPYTTPAARRDSRAAASSSGPA